MLPAPGGAAQDTPIQGRGKPCTVRARKRRLNAGGALLRASQGSALAAKQHGMTVVPCGEGFQKPWYGVWHARGGTDRLSGELSGRLGLHCKELSGQVRKAPLCLRCWP